MSGYSAAGHMYTPVHTQRCTHSVPGPEMPRDSLHHPRVSGFLPHAVDAALGAVTCRTGLC